MFRGSADRQTFSRPREASQPDEITLSSDEEESPVKVSKSSRPRPPVLDSDSEEDDSDLEVVQKSRPRAIVASDSEAEEEEGEEPTSTESSSSRGALARERLVREETENIDSSSEEEEDAKDLDESVVIQQPTRPSPRPVASTSNSMADALASLSFKKKPSPTPVEPAAGSRKFDSDQENALRKQGFLSTSSKPQPKTTDPRSFYAPQPQNSHHMFFKPKFPTTFRTSQTPNLPPPSSSANNFPSSFNAFNLKSQPISVKKRLGAQVKEENKAKGIPISVPKNPPPSIVRQEGKVAPKKKGTNGDLSIVSRPLFRADNSRWSNSTRRRCRTRSFRRDGNQRRYKRRRSGGCIP